MASLVQIFRLGDRVKRSGIAPFIINAVCVKDGCVMYRAQCLLGWAWIPSDDLTLVPERPPYVPSERRIVQRYDAHMPSYAVLNNLYRCETDAELADRHAAEWAAYDSQKEGE